MSAKLFRSSLLLACFILSACSSLPRGAALQNEVLKNADAEDAPFQVVEVTRETVSSLGQWPETGWHGHYHWLSSSHGPNTNVIQTGDRIDLTIWDNQVNSLITGPGSNIVEMKGITVSQRGTIFVPYVDDVNVRGLTADRARERIQSQLGPIAPDAQVQLNVVAGQGNSISVVSGVRSPGQFPLESRNTSILTGLALAGGIDPALRAPVVKLIRGGSTFALPAADLFGSAQKNTRLRAGDKVLVEEATESFTALGASGLEDLIYFPKKELSTLEALSLMGGIDDVRADPQGVLVLREYASNDVVRGSRGPQKSQVVFSIDLTSAEGLFAARNFDIHPGDTVLATESPVTSVRTVFGLIGQVFGIGNAVRGAVN